MHRLVHFKHYIDQELVHFDTLLSIFNYLKGYLFVKLMKKSFLLKEVVLENVFFINKF